ncbi:MAG: GNAT family N-acetyltransferase [bacterium]
MANSGFQIRRAEDRDVFAIADIWYQLMEEHVERDPGYWGVVQEEEARRIYREANANMLARSDHITLVAEQEGLVVGFVNGFRLTRPPMFEKTAVGRINDIAVDRDHRRQGVGHLLLEAIFEEFDKMGFEYIDLTVDRDNVEAIEFYQSMGFTSRELHLIKRIV